MRQGMHDLKLWGNSKADGSSSTSTPGKISGAKDEMARLIKVKTGFIFVIMVSGYKSKVFISRYKLGF